MTVSSDILKLWRQHSSSPFPEGYGGRQINGIDLPLLDAEISGCIRMYINGVGLDPQRVRTLRERLIDLNGIILLLGSEESIYFDRLSRLANLILREAEG